nr:hypothetical protein [uncultured Draconibacterium sp.]
MNYRYKLSVSSCAAAISSDRLQRSLIPFAHSRRTVASSAVTVKNAFGTACKRAILSFHCSPALFFSPPTNNDFTGFKTFTGGKTKKKSKIAGLPTKPTLGKMQDQDECPGLLILHVFLIFLLVSVAILHFILGRQHPGFLFFFSLFSFLLRNVLFVQIKNQFRFFISQNSLLGRVTTLKKQTLFITFNLHLLPCNS